MQSRQKNKQGKALTKAFSVILTLSIIAILIISGPAGAVSIDLSENSESDGVYKYTAEVSINTDDYIPVDFAAIKLKGSEGTYKCYFDIDDEDFNDEYSDDSEICDMITITSIDNDISHPRDEGYGYGYGYSGERATEGDVTIKFKIDSSKAPEGEKFTVRAGIAGLEDDDIEFEYYSDDSFTFTAEGTMEPLSYKKAAKQQFVASKWLGNLILVYGSESKESFSKILKVGDKAYFISGSDLHSVTLDDVGSEMAAITVASTPQQVLMAPGQQWPFDVTNDGKYDVSVQLNHVAGDKALVTITDLQPPVVTAGNEVTGMAAAFSDEMAANGLVILAFLVALFLVFSAFRKKRRF